MIVTTISDKKLEKNLCRSMDGIFYEIGDRKVHDSGDCYDIDGTYYKFNSNNLAWDHQYGGYIDVRTIDYDYVKGYVKSNGEIYGLFKNNPLNNYLVFNGEDELPVYNIDSTETAEKLKLEYNAQYDVFVTPSFDKRRLPTYVKNYLPTKYSLFTVKDYGLNNSENLRVLKNYTKFDEPCDNIQKAIFDLMGGHSFGIETESNSGIIPERILLQTGFAPLKDGSIGGLEYTSMPFKKAASIGKINQFCNVAKEVCTTGDNCSLHIHIGSIVNNYTNQDFKITALAVYMLYYSLQRELFELVPKYKKTYNYLKKKDGKDHCQDIPSLGLFDNNIFTGDKVNLVELNTKFDMLFRFVNDGVPSSERHNYKTRFHVRGDSPKWQIESRYYSLNLYNLFFNQSGTAEFRIHAGTFNPTKVISWLMICNTIIRFAKENAQNIINRDKKYNLVDILDSLKDNFGKEDREEFQTISNYLKAYVLSRKQIFIEDNFNKDVYGREFKDDATFKFIKDGFSLVKSL